MGLFLISIFKNQLTLHKNFCIIRKNWQYRKLNKNTGFIIDNKRPRGNYLNTFEKFSLENDTD